MAFSHMHMIHIGHIYHPFIFYFPLSTRNRLPFMLSASQFCINNCVCGMWCVVCVSQRASLPTTGYSSEGKYFLYPSTINCWPPQLQATGQELSATIVLSSELPVQ